MFGDLRLFEAGKAGFGVRGIWGVFTDKHVDANCRTVNLMFFFKLPYFGLVNCRTQSVFCF